MKKLLVLVMIFSIINGAWAQTSPTKQKPKTPTKAISTPTKPAINSLLDSASYLIGITQANMLKQDGVSRINTKLVLQGCSEFTQNKPFRFEQEASNNAMNKFLIQSKEEKIKRDSGKLIARPISKITNSNPAFKTLTDTASYIMGFRIANHYKLYDIDTLNANLLARGFSDAMENKPALLNESMTSDVLNKLIFQIIEKKAEVNIKAGNEFLAKNKLRPEVKTTPSGLQYEVITEGTGIKPTALDTFVAHYRGTLLDGTEFDASYNRGTPLVLPVKSVITGWTEGLQLMSVGSKYKFYIPYNLGYGVYGSGAIPGGAALIFEVELLDVKKAMSP